MMLLLRAARCRRGVRCDSGRLHSCSSRASLLLRPLLKQHVAERKHLRLVANNDLRVVRRGRPVRGLQRQRQVARLRVAFAHDGDVRVRLGADGLAVVPAWEPQEACSCTEPCDRIRL